VRRVAESGPSNSHSGIGTELFKLRYRDRKIGIAESGPSDIYCGIGTAVQKNGTNIFSH